VGTALETFDPPTRTEATADKAAIIAALPAAPDNTSVAAIKVVTDQMRFTVANQVDSNALTGGGGGGGGLAGAGATLETIHIETAAHAPIPNAGVWLSTDSAGADVIAGTLYTDDAGDVAFMVDIGVSYYVWCDSPRANVTNPTLWAVT
jgi:hypothetical protein